MDRITISEGDLKKIIKKSLGKYLTESTEKKPQIPSEVSQYLKNNPQIVIESLMDSQGNNFYDLVGKTYSKKKKGF